MRTGYVRNNTIPWLVFIFLVLAIPLTVYTGQQIQDYLIRAAVVPANITVDASVSQGVVNPVWQGISQGGELEFDRQSLVKIAPVKNQLASLNIKYVRLDHILNWPLGDRLKEIKVAKDIGATPVISLSYFPTSVANTDTSQPYNWGAWQESVINLVRQVSSSRGLNIPNVYYEVWNEPDGATFGNMSPEQYLVLYRHTLTALSRIQNEVGMQPFKVGGPSLADPNKKDWLAKFIAIVDRENLRLDFISWHRYHRDPQVFSQDIDMVENLQLTYPRLALTEKLVTEWGSDPSANLIHQTNYDAAHFAAVSRAYLGRINIAAKFEARDGAGDADNGKGLGILTYKGNYKPTSSVLKLLNTMAGDRVLVEGEGSNVTGWAMKDNTTLRLVLVNYDKRGFNTENVPITIKGLTPGNYLMKKTIIDGYNASGRNEQANLSLQADSFSLNQVMLVNSVVLLELEKQ